MACILSNGKNGFTSAVTSGILDHGHKYWRWWVDINGDGHPDFCRAVGSNIDGSSGWYDNYGTMSCRLGLGDSFAQTDINVPDFNFGKPDGGRSFCDPVGNGLQTFCRATKRGISEAQVCYEGYNGDWCYVPVFDAEGLHVGLSATLQAEQALLKKYSDGLGAETRLTYLPLSDDRVYARSGLGNGPELSLVRPRQMVVAETRAWQREVGVDEKNWKPLTGNANYFYKDLLVHFEDGSRGFKERYAFQEGNNTLEYTQFHQGPGLGVGRAERLARLGEIGTTVESRRYAINNSFLQSVSLLKGFQKSSGGGATTTSSRQVTVGKVFSKAVYDATPPPITYIAQHPFGLLQRSVNTLDRVNRAGLLPIVYNRETTSFAWDLNGAVMPRGYSLTELDANGNITYLKQDTTAPNGQVWSKTTTNTYADNATSWLLGRLTKATVASTAPTADAQLAVLPRSAGSAPNAAAMSPPTTVPTAPQPISPAVLAAILQLLLED